MDSISDIKAKMTSAEAEELSSLIELYRNDERVGVKNLIAPYEKELRRLDNMSIYEGKMYERGISFIAGVDEVGRGPLAGPVVACALIMPKGVKILHINDSKKLSERKRKELYDIIHEKALSIGIGAVSHTVIDEINILQATYQAMRIALQNLSVAPERILIDAVSIPGIEIPQEPIVKGDEKSVSIAAASIIAKVTRDEMMREYHKEYPEYGFDANKGYGTAAHLEAIKRHGLCKIHRRSFTRQVKKNEDN